MNYATFETARALKKAGFPQPEPEFGQVWYYNEMGFYCTVLEAVFTNNHKVAVNAAGAIMRIEPDQNYFAPSATDIIPHLPQNLRYPIEISGDNIKIWVLENGYSPRSFKGESLAEACAAAWLTLNKK